MAISLGIYPIFRHTHMVPLVKGKEGGMECRHSLYARWRLLCPTTSFGTSKGKGRSDLLIPVQARLCLEEVTFQQVRMVADHFDSYLTVILFLYIIFYAFL